jgi:hypothetical protein
MSECPSRFTLVRFKAGDLEEPEAGALSAHLEQCAACRETLAGIERNVSQYESGAEERLARLRARLDREDPRNPGPVPPTWLRLAPAGGALALAAAAAALVVVLPSLKEGSPGPAAGVEPADPTASSVRFKGAVAVEVVARRGERQFRVEKGAELRPGDALRFVVTVGAPGFISVFSVDALDNVSPFYPDSDPGSHPAPFRVDAAGRHELPGSIILDDSVGDECLVVAFSEKSFERPAIHRRALDSGWRREGRAPRPEEAGEGIRLQTLWVSKVR